MPITSEPPKPLFPWPDDLPTVHLSEELAELLTLVTSPPTEWEGLNIGGRLHRLVLRGGPDHQLELHAEPV